MSFLSGFKTVYHAILAADRIAAPIISFINPAIGGLMMLANRAAVMAEVTITDAKTGSIKKDAVDQTTKAVFDVINEILKEQGKSPLDPKMLEAISASTNMVVSGLNAVSQETTGAK